MTDQAYGTITHDGPESDVVQRKATRIADTFRRDDDMEALLELRTNHPKRFAELPHRNRLGLAYYGLARAAAMQVALADEDAA